jgi:hypothetical protein
MFNMLTFWKSHNPLHKNGVYKILSPEQTNIQMCNSSISARTFTPVYLSNQINTFYLEIFQ